MFNWKSAVAASAIIGGLVVAGASIAASTISKTTYLTFRDPVALPGVTLAAGTYIFELPAPGRDLNLVEVFSKDHKKPYWIGFTEIVDRPDGVRDDDYVTFGEAGPGDARPITVWYPPDNPTGRRFIYR